MPTTQSEIIWNKFS